MHQEAWDQVNTIVMGDLNSTMGDGSTNKSVGQFGLCRRNERGKMLINSCRHDW